MVVPVCCISNAYVLKYKLILTLVYNLMRRFAMTIHVHHALKIKFKFMRNVWHPWKLTNFVFDKDFHVDCISKSAAELL